MIFCVMEEVSYGKDESEVQPRNGTAALAVRIIRERKFTSRLHQQQRGGGKQAGYSSESRCTPLALMARLSLTSASC